MEVQIGIGLNEDEFCNQWLCFAKDVADKKLRPDLCHTFRSDGGLNKT